MDNRFEDFLNERKYLLNVSPKTLVYYNCAFNAWNKHATDGKPATWIKNMLEAGIKPVSVNTYICAMNAYWKWEGAGIKLKYIKEEQKILTTLTEVQIRSLVSFHPRGRNVTRAWLVALTILDTGLRASEVLGLRVGGVNFDALTFTVHGKGNKQRVAPFSHELRRLLYKSLQGRFERKNDFVFATRTGTPVSVRNLERDMSTLGNRLGFRLAPHNLRHCFSINYLRNGGNLEYLRRILGHTSLSTTQKYLRSLGVEAIQEVHHLYSPLSARCGNGR